MRVIGIDPGFDRLGIAILEKNGSKEKILFSDCLISNRKDLYEERLVDIGKRINKIIKEWEPTHLGIEKLFFNQNIKTGIKVAEVRGIIIYEAMLANCTICEYSPQEIKVAVTGYGKSDKKQIIFMVEKITGIKKEKIVDDEYDAIAVGITCLAHSRAIK